MKGWKTFKLKDVCTKIGSGATPRGGKETYITEGISLIRSQNVLDFCFSDDGLAYISEEQAEQLSNVRVNAEDVLLNITGDSVARVCQAPESILPARVNQHVGIIRPDPRKLCPGLLKYYLLSPSFKSFMLGRASAGGTRNALTKGMIENFEITVPEQLKEQKAIAKILSAFDDKIELNRRMNATLEAMARALFKAWFVDFEPVHANRENRPSTSASPEIAKLFPADFENGIPQGWERTTFGTVYQIFDSKRIPLSGKQRESRKGVYPYYGAASVMDYVDDYLFDGIYLLIGEDGSVTKSDGRPVVQYTWGKFWVNNHAHVLQGKGKISTEHLMLAVQDEIIVPYVTGAVQPKLNQANLARIPFIKTTSSVEIAFSAAIAPVYAKVRQNTDESKYLSEARDSLLPRLISGRMSVEIKKHAPKT